MLRKVLLLHFTQKPCLKLGDGDLNNLKFNKKKVAISLGDGKYNAAWSK